MFLAAAPYFMKRFKSNEWILSHFQSSITSVGCITNLLSMLILSNLQAKASYPKRIGSALIINIITFSLLALSTTYFRHVSAAVYLGFVLTMVFTTSLATGLIQNGAFAFASGFGRGEYIQAIMAGQGVAGVLPAIAQIISVLVAQPPSPAQSSSNPVQESSTAAFIYFLTATGISVFALLAFIPLVRRHNQLLERTMQAAMQASFSSTEEAERARRKVVGLWALYRKLHWLAAAVFTTFAVTMLFPVFTTRIPSVRDPTTPQDPPDADSSSTDIPLSFRPALFIPLAFLAWNLGDLLGRLAPLIPSLSLSRRPRLLFLSSLARLVFIPLYLACNIDGRGGLGPGRSDLFYLVVVQFGFGATNGWLGSACMMAAPEHVEEGEREATGGFMGLNLVGGLTVGSLLSFFVGGT